MCSLVDCDNYFTLYTCHMLTGCMVCIHILLWLVGSPRSDMLLRFSCEASPQECAQAADDSDMDPAPEHQGS